MFILDGLTLPPDSNLSFIHTDFGNTWEVSRDFWLFSSSAIRNIASDIERGSPYSPVYEAQFQDEQLKEIAEEVSFK